MKLVADGRVSGADWTTPSSSMPMISWKYFVAILSHWAEPAEVNDMFTTHLPICVCSAMAFFTMCPVSVAGPSR